MKGTCAQQHLSKPILSHERIDKSLGKNEQRGVAAPAWEWRLESFYYNRSLIKKTLHLTYLGMLHMLYYMKEKWLSLWPKMLE